MEVLYKKGMEIVTKCTLCGYGFPTVDGHKQFWTGKDGLKYCCVEHAEVGIAKFKEILSGT